MDKQQEKKHKINFCLSIRRTTTIDILSSIKSNKEKFDYFEVWLDYIEDLDSSLNEFKFNNFVETLIGEASGKLILLTRRDKLEKEKISIKQKIEIARLLNNTEVLFDFDVVAQKDDLEMIDQGILPVQPKNLLLSFHNYTLTPSDSELSSIYKLMLKYSPELFKFSTFCNSESDCVRLLNFGLKLREELEKTNKRYIVLGMGEFGIATRIFGTFWGNAMIFCPESKDHLTAIGQLTREEIRSAELLVLSSSKDCLAVGRSD